ncbi:cbb3-type cytochrome oxidase assembly protein CcoS [Ferrovibrio sp.]|uniref:cbb3-type cytochrome oxidase assembly protein CcoS n=1 Tax=Ferrovibrio sp. TaxID=1917215 RepID=UPI001B4D30A0|nr:cbb3-type cytochrome oxidase assembly protein CcoS [Ferrovibrio sp.]MBP7063668.1 cbb3-type cytochrome oxidase assembly protein CcoS [Ferrovibrio sp.]
MSILLLLIPAALLLGLLGMACFIWALNSGQFDDPETAASRILFDDADAALRERKQP